MEQLVARLKWGLTAAFLLVLLGFGANALLYLRSPTTNNGSSISNIRENGQAAGKSTNNIFNESAQTINSSPPEAERAGSTDNPAPAELKTKANGGSAKQRRQSAPQKKIKRKR